MTERIAELAQRLVIGHKSDGRCVYDEQAKCELVKLYRETGVSVAKLARDCGVNANLLTTWIRGRERKKAMVSPVGGLTVELESTQPAFIPVTIQAGSPQPDEAKVEIQARLPNGVVLDAGSCDLHQAGKLIEMLGRLRCSGSTKG
jgi:transposase